MSENRIYGSGNIDHVRTDSILRKIEENERDRESCECGCIALKDGMCIHCLVRTMP